MASGSERIAREDDLPKIDKRELEIRYKKRRKPVQTLRLEKLRRRKVLSIIVPNKRWLRPNQSGL